MEKININEFTFQWNKEIKEYKNNKGNKCINEFEIVKKIDEGAVWKVYKVIRYYYDENKKIMTKTYALKRTHIMTQYKRRYFKNEEMISYLDEVFNEERALSVFDRYDAKCFIYTDVLSLATFRARMKELKAK